MESKDTTQYDKMRWADDSLSSTEDDLEMMQLRSNPEVDTLKDLARQKVPPIKIYLNNLPFDFQDPSSLVPFLGCHPDSVSISLVSKNGRFTGKGLVTTDCTDIAVQVLDCHGQVFRDRPIYMNLDGYFGRGEAVFKKRKAQQEVSVESEGEG